MIRRYTEPGCDLGFTLLPHAVAGKDPVEQIGADHGAGHLTEGVDRLVQEPGHDRLVGHRGGGAGRGNGRLGRSDRPLGLRHAHPHPQRGGRSVADRLGNPRKNRFPHLYEAGSFPAAGADHAVSGLHVVRQVTSQHNIDSWYLCSPARHRSKSNLVLINRIVTGHDHVGSRHLLAGPPIGLCRR